MEMNLIYAINDLRNSAAHELTSERRKQHIKRIKSLFLEEIKHSPVKTHWKNNIHGISCAIFICLGYLDSFHDIVVPKEKQKTP
jgi:hypothetical protein